MKKLLLVLALALPLLAACSTGAVEQASKSESPQKVAPLPMSETAYTNLVLRLADDVIAATDDAGNVQTLEDVNRAGSRWAPVLAADLTELRAATPPSGFVEFHGYYIKALDLLTQAFRVSATASTAGDLDTSTDLLRRATALIDKANAAIPK